LVIESDKLKKIVKMDKIGKSVLLYYRVEQGREE